MTQHNIHSPEELTNRLIAAIDAELDIYGAESLADFCASVIDSRCDDERDDYAYWSEVRKAFERAAEEIGQANRRHGWPLPAKSALGGER